MKQQQALDLLKMGKNIFLTGAAGAGKTYLLNQYIRYLKEHHVAIAITASTGIAATHLEGSTIHAWSGIGVNESLTPKLLRELKEKERISRNYKRTKVLIIDEVSMLHPYQLDMIDGIAKYILNNEKPFGGMQVILCGDFFQLPPVNTNNTMDTQFAYEADAWNNGDFYICYLNEQHRQQNDTLLTILNDIRSGTAGEHTKVPLRTRYKKEPDGAAKPTILYSRNINVDAINAQALANLSEKEKRFKMQSNGFGKLVEGLKRNCLALEILALKIGAEVMFIKNDLQGKYVNGTRAVVIGFDKAEGWPIVKTHQHHIITAYPEEWHYEENGTVRASITQVPLRLAWAITIHKSQGMTLDAAEIDLGDAFEPGMGYVALSRVRSLNGLKLMNLNPMALTVHPKILAQDQFFQTASLNAATFLLALSNNEKESMQKNTLLLRFNGSKTAPIKKPKAISTKTPTHLVTKTLLEKHLTITNIAKERQLTVSTIISHIEKLMGLKQLDNTLVDSIKKAIPADAFDAISTAFKNSTDDQLTPIYEALNGKYSYTTIKMVRLFMTIDANEDANRGEQCQ